MIERYSVEKVGSPPDPDFHRPNGPGWRIRDSKPPMVESRDEWGRIVGSPRRASAVFGWFARKKDAISHCANLNLWESQGKHTR